MPNIPWWQPQVGERERALVVEVLASNFLNDGEVTTRFEHELAKLVGCRFAVGVTSGTAALFLALAACEIGPGDEVLVPDVTFVATANAVRLTGATPILVDIDPKTLTMDPLAAERAITPRTRALLPVHVSGRAANMPALLDLARRYGLAVVEDAAEALSSKRFGRCLGTFGIAGCVSFSPNKTITTGQGGVVFTNDEAVHIRLRELKDQGRAVRGTGGDDPHPVVGYNFKLTNLQAAVGLGQLERLPERIERLRTLYRRYYESLSEIPSIEFPGFAIEEGEVPQWVDILLDERDALDRRLTEQGIHCRRFWHPLHRLPPYRRPDSEFPIASRQAPRALWLPSAFTLTDREIDLVIAAIRDFYAASSR